MLLYANFTNFIVSDIYLRRLALNVAPKMATTPWKLWFIHCKLGIFNAHMQSFLDVDLGRCGADPIKLKKKQLQL